MKKEDVLELEHVVAALEEAVAELQKSYSNNDAEKLNSAKRICLELQQKIYDLTK